MQIHIQTEHLCDLDAIVRNILADEWGVSVDLFNNLCNSLGGETDFAPPKREAEASERKRRIRNARHDACTRLPVKS